MTKDERKQLYDNLNVINTKFGMTSGNSIVARKICKLLFRYLSRDFINKIKLEATIEILKLTNNGNNKKSINEDNCD